MRFCVTAFLFMSLPMYAALPYVLRSPYVLPTTDEINDVDLTFYGPPATPAYTPPATRDATNTGYGPLFPPPTTSSGYGTPPAVATPPSISFSPPVKSTSVRTSAPLTPVDPEVFEEPTAAPIAVLTSEPTAAPTAAPTTEPTARPTARPTFAPTALPTTRPTSNPSAQPTVQPKTAAPLGKERVCSFSGDPHLVSFLGTPFDLHLEGVYTTRVRPGRQNPDADPELRRQPVVARWRAQGLMRTAARGPAAGYSRSLRTRHDRGAVQRRVAMDNRHTSIRSRKRCKPLPDL